MRIIATFFQDKRFNVPYNLKQTILYGVLGWWIRIRIIKGDYINSELLEQDVTSDYLNNKNIPPFIKTFTVNFHSRELIKDLDDAFKRV